MGELLQFVLGVDFFGLLGFIPRRRRDLEAVRFTGGFAVDSGALDQASH